MSRYAFMRLKVSDLKINSEIRHVRWRKVATREERSPGVADAHIARSIARSRSLETPQRARAGTASLAKARGKFQPNLPLIDNFNL